MVVLDLAMKRQGSNVGIWGPGDGNQDPCSQLCEAHHLIPFNFGTLLIFLLNVGIQEFELNLFLCSLLLVNMLLFRYVFNVNIYTNYFLPVVIKF